MTGRANRDLSGSGLAPPVIPTNKRFQGLCPWWGSRGQSPSRGLRRSPNAFFPPTIVLILAFLAVAPRPAQAAGCDLGQVVGYTLVFAKTIEAYIEGGRKQRGFQGCQPSRVLVFTDNTGVRCKGVSVQSANLPTAYLFAKTQTDLKLCVGNEMLDVAPAQ